MGMHRYSEIIRRKKLTGQDYESLSFTPQPQPTEKLATFQLAIARNFLPDSPPWVRRRLKFSRHGYILPEHHPQHSAPADIPTAIFTARTAQP